MATRSSGGTVVNPSKNIGTAAETLVTRYLQENGFGTAERRALHGTYDLGDITGIPGVVIEVKSGHAAETASDGLINSWLAETETERKNAKADVGVLVVKRKGKGNAGDWWAIEWHGHPEGRRWAVRCLLKDFVYQLRQDGYGDEL
jgi:hypothetical protein